MTPRLTLGLLMVLAASGCAVGPDYVPPKITLTDQFVGNADLPLAEVAATPWWRDLRDPLLDELIGRALAQNLDVEAALARVRAAEATFRGTGLGSQASGTLDLQSIRSGSELTPAETTESSNLNGAFVLDLFGGNRRQREEARRNLDAARLDVGTARLSLLSSLVGSYLGARYNQEAYALTQRNIAALRETLSLVTARRDLGDASDLDLSQAQANLDNALANLPDLRASFEAEVFRIATLLAEPAAPLLTRMQRGSRQPLPRQFLSVGVPADLLRNRPDLRAAERRFAADVAAVGVAVAAFYPSVRLSGSVTETSNDSWSFGPSLSLPVFNRATLASRRDVAIATAQQAEVNWRSAVLEAVRDVQIAQSAYRASLRRAAALRAVVASNDRVLELTRRSYESGASTLLDLLDAQQANASARLNLAGAVRDQASRWAELQVAAGRGWDVGGQ